MKWAPVESDLDKILTLGFPRILRRPAKISKLEFAPQELALTYEGLPARCTSGWETQIPPEHKMFGEIGSETNDDEEKE